MKVLILGAGVVGVSSAWYLAKAGHEVTVIERQSAAGLETSFANAGEISPGYASPWAGPGIPRKAVRYNKSVPTRRKTGPEAGPQCLIE